MSMYSPISAEDLVDAFFDLTANYTTNKVVKDLDSSIRPLVKIRKSSNKWKHAKPTTGRLGDAVPVIKQTTKEGSHYNPATASITISKQSTRTKDRKNETVAHEAAHDWQHQQIHRKLEEDRLQGKKVDPIARGHHRLMIYNLACGLAKKYNLPALADRGSKAYHLFEHVFSYNELFAETCGDIEVCLKKGILPSNILATLSAEYDNTNNYIQGVRTWFDKEYPMLSEALWPLFEKARKKYLSLTWRIINKVPEYADKPRQKALGLYTPSDKRLKSGGGLNG